MATRDSGDPRRLCSRHRRVRRVPGAARAHELLGAAADCSRLMPNSEALHITARFPLPQVRHAAIFPPIFLERQTLSNPYLSIYLSRRVRLGQSPSFAPGTKLIPPARGNPRVRLARDQCIPMQYPEWALAS